MPNLFMTGIDGANSEFEKRKVYRYDTVRRRTCQVVEKEFEHRLVGLARHNVKLQKKEVTMGGEGVCSPEKK